MRWCRPRTIHPAVPELQEQLRTSDLDRREFLRTVRQVQDYATHPSLYHHFNGVWLA